MSITERAALIPGLNIVLPLPPSRTPPKKERLTELVGLLLEVDPLLCGGDVEEVADDELAAGAGGEVTRARVQHGERGRGDDTP